MFPNKGLLLYAGNSYPPISSPSPTDLDEYRQIVQSR